MGTAALLLAFLISTAAPAGAAEGGPGRALFDAHCGTCHADAGSERGGPSLLAMRQMNAAQLEFTLTRGKMREQASGLNQAERLALMSYLSANAAEGGYRAPAGAYCAPGKPIDLQQVRVGSWGLDEHNSRYQPPSRTRIDARNVGDLTLAWTFGLPGATDARSQPVITADTVFVLSPPGNLFALDRASGCIKWQYDSDVPLRTSLSLGMAGDVPALFFGDFTATAHAVAAATGELLWRKPLGQYDTSTLTGAMVPLDDTLLVPLSSFEVVVAANPEYECCKSHGVLYRLDAASGQPIWARHTTDAAQPTYKSSAGVQQWGPSGVPIWSTPTIDRKRGLVYVGTGENSSSPATELSDAIIAIELATGAIRWSYQATANDAWNGACGRRQGPNCPRENGPDFDFGAAPILARTRDGRELVLAGQKSGVVHALDPDTGKLLWQTRLSDGTALGGVHWGMALAGERLFVPIADPERPGFTARPGVYALDTATGAVLWSHKAERGCETDAQTYYGRTEPWPDCSFPYGYSAAATATDDLVFAAALNGKVRAFDAATGTLAWEYDTLRPFDAVNGEPTHGGAIDNAGVQLADDMLFVQSGYGSFGQLPGNALLAFRVTSHD
ncbi:MAG: PQQ-binding-like beta-propeller repeat protein [Pseudomonadales bacterium]